MIVNLDDAPALIRRRYGGGEAVTKAGMLPFRHIEGIREYLLVSPVPKRNAQDVVPFGIARGTRRALVEEAGRRQWRDMEREAMQGRIVQEETGYETALREAEEELGVTSAMLARCFDCGVLAYKEYGIRLFACELKTAAEPLWPEDAREIRWFTRAEAEAAVVENRLKEGYLHLLHAIDSALDEEEKRR